MGNLSPTDYAVRIAGFLVLFFYLTSCQTKRNASVEQSTTRLEIPNESAVFQPLPPADNPPGSLTITVIPAPENTFGYNVLTKGKVLVHQPHIPGLSGIKGFATAERAHKTAELVQYKIAHRQMSPRVSLAELDSLGVLR